MSHAQGRLAPPAGHRGRPRQAPLAGDEDIVLRSQGGYRNNIRSAWRIGQLFLTHEKLIFSTPIDIVFQTPLADVESIEVERQRFAAGREKDVIAVGYRAVRPAKAFIIVPDLELWRRKLYEMTLFEIDQAAVDKVTQELDPRSREIVDYLWAHQHATINELAELIGAPTHMDVLLKIRGIINPTAERVIGSALLAFHRRQVDWVSGEPVLFSWWVAASPRIEEGAGAGLLLDLFDEGDRVFVVADLGGVRDEDIALEVSKDRLIVSVEGPEERFRGEVALPAPVNTGTLTRSYTNGVLAVALEKMLAGQPRPGNPNATPDPIPPA